MEFHKRALRFFSRPSESIRLTCGLADFTSITLYDIAWKKFFRSLWKDFRTQFQYILTSLSRHKGLVESQASLVEYEQSKAARLAAQKSFEDIARAETRRRLLAVTEKIHPPHTLTDHEGAAEIRQDYPESGKWILRHPFLRDWLDFTRPNVPALWVNGIPGAGIGLIFGNVSSRCSPLADNVPRQNRHCFSDHRGSENHRLGQCWLLLLQVQ